MMMTEGSSKGDNTRTGAGVCVRGCGTVRAHLSSNRAQLDGRLRLDDTGVRREDHRGGDGSGDRSGVRRRGLDVVRATTRHDHDGSGQHHASPCTRACPVRVHGEEWCCPEPSWSCLVVARTTSSPLLLTPERSPEPSPPRWSSLLTPVSSRRRRPSNCALLLERCARTVPQPRTHTPAPVRVLSPLLLPSVIIMRCLYMSHIARAVLYTSHPALCLVATLLLLLRVDDDHTPLP
jgi:hypothetical protein